MSSVDSGKEVGGALKTWREDRPGQQVRDQRHLA